MRSIAQRSWIWSVVCFVLSLVATLSARADVVVFSQPADPAGGQYKSAWYAPDGLDGDEYVWDAFTLPASTAITQVQWRGGYTNALSGAGKAPVYNFTVAIYASIGGGSQPNVVNPPLVRYQVGGNAGETPAGIAGGVAMYDYHFTLPSPFQAVGGTKYWIQIVASQGLTPIYFWPPDWSLAKATGGDGGHFRKITGGNYAAPPGDCTFSLLASSAPTATISASEFPVGAGAITGAGAYPIGSVATLRAVANAGFGFVKWTEGAAQVSTNATYTFTASANRTLVANFVPAYTVTTAVAPIYGGTVTGSGTYLEGATATVSATPKDGFVFTEWTEYGASVSTSPTYSFAAGADRALVANFVNGPGWATFDFDNAVAHTPFPVSLTSGDVGATFSGTGAGYSIQAVGTVGIAPPGFSGLCVFPSSVFASDLVCDFTATVSDFNVLYSPQELACDTSATMRVTAFMDGVMVGTNTATAPIPGTWPSGTLKIHVPGGFNRAVVHYDSRPPTCTDYGVIFLADDVTVKVICTPASIMSQPTAMVACPNGTASFAVAAAGTGLAYQWQLEESGTWTDLVEGSNVTSDGLAAIDVTGTQTPAISARVLWGLGGNLRCVVSNACSAATSDSVSLSLRACSYGPCIADYDGSGGTPDASDIDAFFAEWLMGAECADADCSGGTPDAGDIDVFFGLWLNGGC